MILASRDIDFDEFLKIMLPVFTGKFDDEELWYAFKKFDTDGSGYVSVSELKLILAKIGQHFSDRQIQDMVNTVDADNDGRLSFNGNSLTCFFSFFFIQKYNSNVCIFSLSLVKNSNV